jgi:phosphoribosylanthranilate isomerase
MKKKILVKNISNLSEARYCAGMMVDMIAFNFDQNETDYIEATKFTEITNWLSGVKILGTGINLNSLEISKLIENNKLDGFVFDQNQIDTMLEVDCDIKVLEFLNSKATDFNLEKLKANCNLFIVLDENPILIDFLKEKNVETLLGYDKNLRSSSILNVAGYAFLGSKESRPGFSNYNLLIDNLEFLEETEI